MNEMRFPPAGTKCVDCGCCEAKVYAAGDALCWACDAGSHPEGKIEHKAGPVEIPPIRLEPLKPKTTAGPSTAAAGADRAQDDKPVAMNRCEVREEQEVSRVEGVSKRGQRIGEEIRAKILAEPLAVNNCEVARKYGVSDSGVAYIRKCAGLRSAAKPGSHGHRATEKPAPRSEKPTAIEKKFAHKQAAIEYKRAHGTRSVQVVHSDPRKFSITVQISEAEADAYWRALTPEQKAATIGLQFQSIIDERVAPGA